jgi:hypothetical protein
MVSTSPHTGHIPKTGCISHASSVYERSFSALCFYFRFNFDFVNIEIDFINMPFNFIKTILNLARSSGRTTFRWASRSGLQVWSKTPTGKSPVEISASLCEEAETGGWAESAIDQKSVTS